MRSIPAFCILHSHVNIYYIYFSPTLDHVKEVLACPPFCHQISAVRRTWHEVNESRMGNPNWSRSIFRLETKVRNRKAGNRKAQSVENPKFRERGLTRSEKTRSSDVGSPMVTFHQPNKICLDQLSTPLCHNLVAFFRPFWFFDFFLELKITSLGYF